MHLLRDERLVRRKFWPKLLRVLSLVPFAEDAVAAWCCAFDPATPLRAKATLIAALAYFILPADALPDIIPVLGFSDDVTVLAAAIAMIRNHMKPEHRERARARLKEMARTH